MKNCPCGSKHPYADCCERYHSHQAWPQTAEQLMRSRYSAYALRLTDYLLDTWEKSTRPGRFDIEDDLTWIKLRVLKTRKGAQSDKEGWVWFKADFMAHEEKGSLREKSYFLRDENGHWQYVSGETSFT